MLGRGTDAEPGFVTVCLSGIFSCRNPECCLECWNQNFQPALDFIIFFFQCRNQFFIGIVGKTFLEIYPVPVTFVCKEGECQFSVEGVKNVNMSELENFRHCLPTFCLCLHTTCLRQVWLFPHNHNRSPWCKFPSAFPLLPFLFSHWDVKMLQ